MHACFLIRNKGGLNPGKSASFFLKNAKITAKVQVFVAEKRSECKFLSLKNKVVVRRTIIIRPWYDRTSGTIVRSYHIETINSNCLLHSHLLIQ